MSMFEGSQNFIINGSYFISQSGEEQSIDDVLERLKDATAPRVTHASIDRASYPDINIDSGLLPKLLSPRSDERSEKLYFIHSIGILLASFFFRRRGPSGVWPADYRRLVPTIAYQICASRSCPRKLKTEILGAFYMEPNIPEQTVHNQFQKLLISPLRKFSQDLTSTPVIIVLDSIHHCEDVKHIITPIVQVIDELPTDEHQVNMKFVASSQPNPFCAQPTPL
ncbi:hypothetical protein F5887DRAFT_1069344 [Amanita rubescens]|nr:hypothetical protein F5887DRAFT_1069344 [Amanita rubescens]